jgi:hypothetical protein
MGDRAITMLLQFLRFLLLLHLHPERLTALIQQVLSVFLLANYMSKKRKEKEQGDEVARPLDLILTSAVRPCPVQRRVR